LINLSKKYRIKNKGVRLKYPTPFKTESIRKNGREDPDAPWRFKIVTI